MSMYFPNPNLPGPIWQEPDLHDSGGWPPTPFQLKPPEEQWRDYVEDLITFGHEKPGIVEVDSPEAVAEYIHDFFNRYPKNPASYLTGGLECGSHHTIIYGLTAAYCSPYVPLTIMGLESNEWIESNKGRPTEYDLDTRMAFWKRALNPPAVIFTVPDGTQDYNALSIAADTYKHPNVLHLSSLDDPPYLQEARRSRALTDRHFWLFAIGRDPNGVQTGVMIHPSHTSSSNRQTS